MKDKKRQVAGKFHPGEYIRDELSERGWTVPDLALKTGLNTHRINEILNEKASVTRLVADALASAFGTGPSVWLNLQKAYDAKIINPRR